MRIIQTFQNILNMSMYDETNMQVKKEYTGLLDTLLTMMCANSIFGDNATLAFTTLSTLQSFKYDIGDNGLLNHSIGIGDSPNSTFVPGIVNLGSELASKYREWQCTTDYKCNGKTLLPEDCGSFLVTQRSTWNFNAF